MSAIQEESQRIYRVQPSEALRFVQEILEGNGTKAEDALTVAEALIQADLRGVDTHGANRLPSYMERVRNGVLDPKAEMQLEKKTPVVGLLDAKNGGRQL